MLNLGTDTGKQEMMSLEAVMGGTIDCGEEDDKKKRL